MATNTVFKQLLTLSRTGQRASFLQVLDSYSLLKTNPEHMGPRNVSLLIHSFGNLRFSEKKYWRILQSYFHSLKEDMNSHDIAVSVLGFSKSSQPLDGDTWKSLEHGTRQYLMQFTPRELSSICYSFAVINCQSKLLWDGLRNALMGQVFYMTPENLPPIVWAFSKMGIKDEKIWYMLERKIFMELKKMSPACQSIIMYGFAVTMRGSEELWSLFEKVFYENIVDFADKDIRNVVWSLRKMKRNNGNNFNTDVVSMIKSDLDKYSIGTIVGIGHAMRESGNLTPEFKQMLANCLKNDEKVEEMTYAHAISFSKLLFHTKVKDNELWDKLALRLRQLLPTTPAFDLKAHLYFAIQNPTYWHFFCEEAMILYFERVSKMSPKGRESSVSTEDYWEVVNTAHYCYSNKIGVKMFWGPCGKFLQNRRKNIYESDPVMMSKLMYTLTGRFVENNVLMGYWMEYAQEICSDLELLKKFMRDAKGFRVLMRSFIKIDQFPLLLKQLEKLYDTHEMRDDDIVPFIGNAMNWKKEGEEKRKFPIRIIRAVLETYNKEEKMEIVKAIFENWFNLYCEAQYAPRAVYEDLYEKLIQYEEKISQEKEEKVTNNNEEEETVEENKQEFQLKIDDIMVESSLGLDIEPMDNQNIPKMTERKSFEDMFGTEAEK